MTTLNSQSFDNWIRTEFKSINTELEELYFEQNQRSNVDNIGEQLKLDLLNHGNQHIDKLLAEGNTDQGFDNGFDLLGNVGFFMAACRRHELTVPERETRSPLTNASALAMQLGASLGVIPRFASAHLETHNRAIDGQYRTFTSLHDEKVFLDYNTRSVFAYIRASQALLQTLPLGISHPVTFDLLNTAKQALDEVFENNEQLFDKLDMDRFFYCVRPYYKTYRVGLHEYRGANAGDFAGINVIDLLLGLCRADDPYYSQLLVDKFLFMRPEDQLVLRDCMRRPNLLDLFLNDISKQNEEWFQTNLQAFIAVCEAHGKAAQQHHHRLVKQFIEVPAEQSELTDKQDLTASGPPLPVLLKALKKLSDLRAATKDDEIPSRYNDLNRLKDTLRS